ncbi:MAG: hypothetical protein KAJ98_03020, partial [Spirochaetaceae bacterium]|nr:hypothetical protein [Spirochaetaceae bacterium]
MKWNDPSRRHGKYGSWRTMGEQVMQIDDEQMSAIGDYVRLHIHEWIDEPLPSRYISQQEMDLRERMVRVEESLDKNYELIKQGFGLMEKRFEQVDKRFEEMSTNNNLRFAQVDKRFEEMS